MLIALPIQIAKLVSAVACVWKTMTGLAHLLVAAGHESVAEMLYAKRMAYVVYRVSMFILGGLTALLVAAILQVKNVDREWWWLPYALLPVQWCFGWLLILHPLEQARAALRAHR